MTPGSAVQLPDGVRRTTVQDAPALVVETEAAQATLHLDGGHLTSWTPAGESDLLWMSPASAVGDGEAIRGGIPLIGPWFGPGRDGAMPTKHGWLRSIRWELVSAALDGDEVLLDLRTPSDVAALSASATFRIGRELSVDLSITAAARPLELEAALHTYLAVADVRQIAIEGLGGAAYLDNTRGLAAEVQHEQALRLTGSTDRIYDVSGQVVLDDEARGRRIVSSPRGTGKTVVWNPWDQLVTDMADIPDETWPQFVCIEPAIAKDRFVALEAGQSHTIGVTYRIES